MRSTRCGSTARGTKRSNRRVTARTRLTSLRRETPLDGFAAALWEIPSFQLAGRHPQVLPTARPKHRSQVRSGLQITPLIQRTADNPGQSASTRPPWTAPPNRSAAVPGAVIRPSRPLVAAVRPNSWRETRRYRPTSTEFLLECSQPGIQRSQAGREFAPRRCPHMACVSQPVVSKDATCGPSSRRRNPAAARTDFGVAHGFCTLERRLVSWRARRACDGSA